MIISQNIMALNTWRNLSQTNQALSKTLERLSSGLRINRAADDAAGLAISEKMRAQIRGLNQAARNAQDGISLIQTAEGAIGEIHNILQRMRELATQAASDGMTDSDRQQIQKEIDQLARQITDIANTTQFNTKRLLTGEYAVGRTSIVIHVGANKDENLEFNIAPLDAYSLGVGRDALNGSLANQTIATSISDVGAGIDALASYRLNYDKDVATLSNAAIATAVTAQGTGINPTAQYRLTYNASTKELTLEKWNGTAWTTVGSPSDVSTWNAGSSVTVGDTSSNETLTVTLGPSAPSQNAVTDIQFKSYLSLQKSTDGGTNWSNVGNALDVTGTNWRGNSEVTLGNTSSGETVTVTLAQNAPTADASTSVTFTLSGYEPGSASNGWKARTAGGVLVSNQSAANRAIDVLNAAINKVSGYRADLGALQNRLEHTITNLQITAENLQAAESRIRGADMAQEMMNFVRQQILLQSGTAMLAQANAVPQTVLQLLA